MSILDKKTSADAVKLLIFILTTTMATGVLVVLIGNLTFQSARDYKAVFSDATGVVKGDDIRIAGVKVGSVKDVEVIDRTRALVSFDVADSSIVTQSSTAQVRYRNLVGQRYIALEQGDGPQGMKMTEGQTIDLDHTSPAVNLTTLFNGFRPLFQTLSADDVNRLSYQIIQVFQGEGGTISELVRITASLTNTIADKDRVIGDVIDNLNVVLTTVNEHDEELNREEAEELVDGEAYEALDS